MWWLCRFRMDVQPGARHSHPHDQLVYVIAGHLTIVCGDAEPFDVRGGDSFVVRHLKRANAALLRWAFRRRALVGAVVGATVAAAAAGAVMLPRSFLPPFNEGTLLLTLQYDPGISLAESHRLGFIADRLVAEVPEVRSVGRRTGRAELDEHAEGVEDAHLRGVHCFGRQLLERELARVAGQICLDGV